MTVTIKDIARRAGVSAATVSKVLNRKDAVIGEETRQKIRSIAQELNYTPNSLARMKSYGSKDVCLHDPCVIAYLLDPSIFGGVHGKVDVDCVSIINRARTVVAISERHRGGQVPSCYVVTDVDDNKLFALLNERLASF